MQKENIVNGSQSISLHFGFRCLLHEEGDQKRFRRRNSLCHWIFLITILIFLQYVYNTSYYHGSWREEEREGNKSNFNKTNCSMELSKFTFDRSVHYHDQVLSYKRFMAMNYKLINLGEPELPKYLESTPICRLNLSALGPIKINKKPRTIKWLSKRNTSAFMNLRSGGFYSPKHCRPRHKVAILIPYRKRQRNLAIFLYNMHPLLQKQLLQYRIFVIEQYGRNKFNKGALYNIAYLETQRFGTWHCYIFHDVDLIPEDERILYSCPKLPTHLSSAVQSMDYKLGYQQLFGGVTAMTPQQYFSVNGYSNMYWNWGAEDDDMFVRLQASRFPIFRYDTALARYTTLPHKKNRANQYRYTYLYDAKRRFRREGLSTLQYKLISIVKQRLFTHILADVNPFREEE